MISGKRPRGGSMFYVDEKSSFELAGTFHIPFEQLTGDDSSFSIYYEWKSKIIYTMNEKQPNGGYPRVATHIERLAILKDDRVIEFEFFNYDFEKGIREA